jgi:hypothetical protein
MGGVSLVQDFDKYINSYLDWIKTNIFLSQVNDEVIKITSPFVDRHNDCIEIYAVRDDNGYILTDDGYTISDLELCGIKFDTGRRKEALDETLAGFGIKRSDSDALYCNCGLGSFPSRKHDLIQSILAVNDLYRLSKTSVVSYFYQDVEDFLRSQNVRYIDNINIQGLSGLNTHFDFAIPETPDSPQRFVKVSSKMDTQTARNFIFSWSDTRPKRRPGTLMYVFIKDEDTVNSAEALNALNEYDITPIMWSERAKRVNLLAS